MPAVDPAKIALWLENLRDERDGVALYRGLASVEKDGARAREFSALADAEERHAAIWQRKLDKAGVALPDAPPSARVRFLLWMAGQFGIQSVLPMVVMAESSDVAKYAKQGGRESAALVAEEQEHGATLRRLSGAKPYTPRALIGERERWHSVGRGGTLRAGVFGANDGLVSNLSLVLGVAAAGAQRGTLLLTGLAGLFAGALSMAVGEYVSVASQRDILRRQIVLESRELAEAPEEEEAELAQLLRDKGLSDAQAGETARQIMLNPDSALDTMVREELGLDPDDLGSPARVALSSFLTFAAGAALPLLPLFFLSGRTAAVGAAVLGAVVLGGVGALLGFLSGTNPVRAAARMIVLAALAAGVTVGVGRLVGASLG
jgi:VIT1/CCC1 family predicted Fe2+/Mn2+ transporter